METMFCATCAADCMIEQPPCVDGHVECPERVCIMCGTAIVAGWLVEDAPATASAHTPSHAA